MKKLVLLLIIFFFASEVKAIGVVQLVQAELQKKNITINKRFIASTNCFSFVIKSPDQIYFPELGLKPFIGAMFHMSGEKSKYNIIYKDTRLNLPIDKQKGIYLISGFCVSKKDLPNSYISLAYKDNKGILMHLLIKLADIN